ncbi:tyrosine-type recombinase/integrase [Salicibibacter cibarius]|uniref:Tyrosine-type recombinase/integrase n=1 Tax=Salicibibacter cibarius TaxID=2743000 RepID=A0A7T6Z0J8_9BACI|nr:tyrosine-type recombinase/integrase [Salicibibacter cibarius]QQK74201.1 tyrosine-type recombinase/integrase [Salicibibacter cibarius]
MAEKRKTIKRRKGYKRPAEIKELSEALEFVVNVKMTQNVKPRTIKDYRKQIQYFNDWLIDNYGEDVKLTDVDIDLLREYVRWCRHEKIHYEGHPLRTKTANQKIRGLSAATVNIRIRLLKSFFRTLYEEKVINVNPTENLKLMKVEKDNIQPLTKEEIKRLLSAPDQGSFAQFRDYVAILLMLDTGMRIGEVCAVDVQDVDLKAKRIILPASVNKNRRARVLPLSDKTTGVLRQLINETQEAFTTNAVFTTYAGDRVNDKTLQKGLHDYAAIAGIDRTVTPHILRHCFAKYASLNGMDIFTLQRILGHEEITTTRKYVQIHDEDVMEQHKQHSPLSWL